MTGADWIAALAASASSGRPCVVVTVLRVEGSAPREPGAKMVVWEDGFAGSVGGGHLELEALAAARALLAAGAAPAGPLVNDYKLGPALGQCCGGVAALLFEAVLPPRWQVAVFGAGHVGKALVKLLADLPCAVTWVDGREAEFPRPLPPGVRQVLSEAAQDEVASLPPGSDVVVMTHSHALDQEVVEAALRRGDLGYVGVIGSATKRARFTQRLSARGFPPERIAALVCPIGVAGIGSKLPAVIAVAVAAQLLQRRSGRGSEGRG
jgi:xanthine dehydrogenase accessory factor